MSGIYIPGMEMPSRTEAHCMFVKEIDGSVQLHVCTKSDMFSSDWEHYPLLLVPDHGGLIDKRKLYEQTVNWELQALQRAYAANRKGTINEFLRWSTICSERTAFKFDVADAPIIIPSETRGEKWRKG